jgi:hypothetical protein
MDHRLPVAATIELGYPTEHEMSAMPPGGHQLMSNPLISGRVVLAHQPLSILPIWKQYEGCWTSFTIFATSSGEWNAQFQVVEWKLDESQYGHGVFPSWE